LPVTNAVALDLDVLIMRSVIHATRLLRTGPANHRENQKSSLPLPGSIADHLLRILISSEKRFSSLGGKHGYHADKE
jgi:hypothetical protein